MKIEEVSIPSYLKENLLKEGIRELYPPQEEAIKKRVLEGENLVLATPTASGKTLVAIFATAKHLENNGKVLYLTPLRALAAEKYNEFKKYFGNKASVIATYGDYDSSDPWLSKYDIIITTNEKCLHPEEKVIVLINNELKIYKIRDLFNEFKNKCKIIKNGEKIDIVPYEKIYTLSYSFEKNEIVFSPILSIIKASGKNDMIELSFEGGKKLRCTKDHPIFILEKGKLKLIQAGESKKKYGIIFIDLSRILKKKITNINLFKLFKENNFERDFSCKISYVEYNSLVNVLIKEGKSKRRAKEKAKWYIKEGIIPMRIACKLGSKVKITHIFGLRRDSSHFIPTLITLDEKLGKLVGYYISEGSSYKSKRKFGYTYLRIATKSDWIKNDVITTCESLGIPYKIYGKNKHEIRIVSKPLYYLFTKIWKLGNNAKEKKLPDFVFFAPTSFIKGLLSALFAGDGGLSPTAIEYSTKNNLLALQLQILLTRFNVHASIYPQKVKGYRKIYWRTVIKGAKNLQRFLKNNLIEMPTLLENTEKIAFSIRGRDDMFINLPAREIISNNFKGSYRFPNFHAALYRMHRVNRKSVFAIARFLNNKEIMKVIKAPIGYIKVKSIEKERNNTQEVYNLQTTTGNYFTAEGILIHNCDSLLRHGAEWIKNISLIVVDEVHLLGDSERGPTLEMTVTKILETVPNAQVLSLSATIKNAEEIANWLKSKLINIDWRPVPLKEGIYYDGIIEFSNGDIKEINFKDFESVINIALETIMEKGQALIFTTTRRKAEKIAEKAAKVLSKTKFKSLLKEKTLQQYADKILEIGGKSSYAEKIAHVIKKGAAYHHAGLSYPYRTLIEDAFRKKYIKILAATPTLAAGVNLPARTVIIPELWRYSPEIGLYSIPVLEYKQYCGRAGRPRYDKVGYAISIARKKAEKELIFNKYINGDIEKIWSRLSDERHLRSHILAIIASNYANNIQEIFQLFEKTFFAKQYGIIGVKEKIHSIIEFLNENEMIEIYDKEIKATKLGKRVSELYIDPLTAIILVNGLKHKPKILSEISILHLISRTPDVPGISAIRIPLEKLELYYQLHKNELLVEAPDIQEDPLEYEIYLEDFKKVIILESWINEISEGEIYEKYRVEPGDLAVLRESAEWIIYSAHEISKIINEKSKIPLLKEMIERVKHGIKSELIQLARLEGIGRVRARALYQAGFKTIEDLSKAPLNALVGVPTIGLKTAILIKKQVGGKIDEKFLKYEKDFEQTSLSSYE